MLRRTEIYPMANSTGNGLRNIGFSSMREESREPLEGDQLPWGTAHPSAYPYPYGAEGVRNPGGPQDPRGPRAELESEVSYVWEPHLISVAAKVVDATGAPATAIATQILASFVSYRVWNGARDPSSAADATVLEETTEQQPFAGFRRSQIGARLLYATNAGKGYRVPRQVLPNNRCAAKVSKTFALVLSHDLDLTFDGSWIVDWEWRLYQV